MDRTDERRRRPPQGQLQRRPGGADRRQPGGYDRPPQRRSQPTRREEYPPRSRSSQPQRSRPPQQRQYADSRRYSYGEAPRTRRYEESPRRRPPQDYRRERTYEDVPSRRYNSERRQRMEQERRRRQRQKQRNLVTVLLVVVASIMAVFCLYDPEDGKVRLPRPLVEAHTDVPPTEPPTEAPTKPPIVVNPITCLEDLGTLQVPDYVSVQIIDVDYHSRRDAKLTAIENIVIHYVGNPGTTAQQNRDWYADTLSNVSSHFVVGLKGEVIQCIPLDEASSASNHRNFDTISIEICHPDESGKFTDATYESVVELTAWLVKACGMDVEQVIRHYEVTGKICPKYYVENEDAWVQLRADVAARVAQ